MEGHTKYRGYMWRLCPYSTEYAARYYNRSAIPVDNPLLPVNDNLPGPSSHPSLATNSWTALPTSSHSTTSGTMEYSTSGGVPGWICKDPNCYYHTTVAPGEWYYES